MKSPFITPFLRNFKWMFTALFFCLLMQAASSQSKHTFKFDKTTFLLDEKPLQIISGELHPARIPREYWRHRIQMVKAMGCNTIAAYVFWNYHEEKEGTFDFTTGNRNIAAFIRLCQEEGMWVLLRPGPYVCAEWDFGGLPPYLLRFPGTKIRCMDPVYMRAVQRYIVRLSQEVKNLQVTRGGPILMLQIENEYGSYANDKIYMEALRKAWLKNGFNIPFYTSDGPTGFMLDAGNIDGAAIGMDSGSSEADFDLAKKHNPNVPAFSSETYPGWLTHWGEKWARPDTNGLKKEIDFLLSTSKSFNLYVIHGGTNFGFTAGANAFSPTQYQPDITSYDYDAPINEQGLATPKYFMLRRMIQAHLKAPLPALPAPVPVIQVPAINLQDSHSVWDYQLPVLRSPQPKTMEAYGQNQGLILYKTNLIGHKSGTLKIWEPHDYALVFLDGKFVDTVYRDGGKWEVQLPKSAVKDPVLEILVEGMGHINFAQFMIDPKGITDRVTLNGMTLMNWETSLLPMNENFIKSTKPVYNNKANGRPGVFFKGEFKVNGVGDTYFDLSNYVKGMVYINGHLLGRYWNIGPQQRLYCPASWLQKGSNQIIVFDLLQTSAATVSGFTTIE
ncbi:MAG: beta-galactosidase family protein [Bacteroidota bacterium]